MAGKHTAVTNGNAHSRRPSTHTSTHPTAPSHHILHPGNATTRMPAHACPHTQVPAHGCNFHRSCAWPTRRRARLPPSHRGTPDTGTSGRNTGSTATGAIGGSVCKRLCRAAVCPPTIPRASPAQASQDHAAKRVKGAVESIAQAESQSSSRGRGQGLQHAHRLQQLTLFQTHICQVTATGHPPLPLHSSPS